LEERATHAETHNLYGLMMAKASYEGLERLRPNQRSFVLTRSGFAGIQRYSAVWTGDNQSLWEHLEMSLPMLCNLGLSGVAFVGADIGGFAGNATAELFARWMQVGMLYPLMRAHSALTSTRHEPWVFGERVEQICRHYIELRYQLLPYLYSLLWQASTTGAPILRPLLYHYPNDPKTYQLQDQVLLGPFLMAAPVCRPGVEYRAVYLPEGVWYDWWSGDRYDGPTHILAAAPLDRMPLYVKAGAIIPMQPVMQYVDEGPVDHLTLKVWPGDGEFTLYEDDGQTWNYRQGVWCTMTCQVKHDNDRLNVTLSQRQGSWQPSYTQLTVEMVDIGKQHFDNEGKALEANFYYIDKTPRSEVGD
jgi:alpha-glucosidase